MRTELANIVLELVPPTWAGTTSTIPNLPIVDHTAKFNNKQR